MQTSERFGFVLPSRDNPDDIADINQVSNNFRIIDEKMVEREDNKGLSTEDFTTEEKEKLSTLQTDALSKQFETDVVSSVVASKEGAKLSSVFDELMETTLTVKNNEVVLKTNDIFGTEEKPVAIKGVATPDGTDPTQAVNVAYLKNMPQNVSSVVPNTKSGTAIAITDISPIEHTLKIKATSDTVDVSMAKVQRYGGNILNQDAPTGTSIFWEKQGEYWVGTNANYAGLSWGGYRVSKGQTITVSFDCDSVGKGSRCIITKGKPDCVGERMIISQLGRNIISYTATEDMNVFINFMDFGPDGVYKIKNIMLCYGTNTEYEPYTEPTTYDISIDGTVEGVKSLYPTTTLVSDTEGVVLDVNYNADTKKYIDNKIAEVVALALEV